MGAAAAAEDSNEAGSSSRPTSSYKRPRNKGKTRFADTVDNEEEEVTRAPTARQEGEEEESIQVETSPPPAYTMSDDMENNHWSSGEPLCNRKVKV